MSELGWIETLPQVKALRLLLAKARKERDEALARAALHCNACHVEDYFERVRDEAKPPESGVRYRTVCKLCGAEK